MTGLPLPSEGTLVAGVHRFPVRVYYEDTDAAGIVYYANYLKFAERARTEMMRRFGVEHEKWRETEGVAFIVRRVAIEYRAPARLDDVLEVETRIKELGGASILLDQDIKRDDTLLADSSILIACVGRNGRAVRLPRALRAALLTHNETSRMVIAHAR